MSAAPAPQLNALLRASLDMPLGDLLHSLFATTLPPHLTTLPPSHSTAASPSPSAGHSASSTASPFTPAVPVPPSDLALFEAQLSPSPPSSLPPLRAMSNPARTNNTQQHSGYIRQDPDVTHGQQQQGRNNTRNNMRPSDSNMSLNTSASALSQLVQGVPGLAELLFAGNQGPSDPPQRVLAGPSSGSGSQPLMTTSGRRPEEQQEQLQQLLLLDTLCQLGAFGPGQQHPPALGEGEQQHSPAFGEGGQQATVGDSNSGLQVGVQTQTWTQNQLLPSLTTSLEAGQGMGQRVKQEPLGTPLGFSGLRQQHLQLKINNSNSNSNSSSCSQLLPGSFSLPQQQPAQLRSAHSAPPQALAATHSQGQQGLQQSSTDRQHSAPSSHGGMNSLVRVPSDAMAACGLKRDSPWQHGVGALPPSKARRIGTQDGVHPVSRQIDVQSVVAHSDQAHNGVAWSHILQELEMGSQAPAEAPGAPARSPQAQVPPRPAGPEIATALLIPGEKQNVSRGPGIVTAVSIPGDKRSSGAAVAAAGPEAPSSPVGVAPTSRATGVPSSSARSGEGQDATNKESDEEELEEARGQGFSGDENQKTRVSLERERRHRIRDGIKALRAKIRGKGNSASILKQAVSYIHTLETEVQSLKKALEEEK